MNSSAPRRWRPAPIRRIGGVALAIALATSATVAAPAAALSPASTVFAAEDASLVPEPDVISVDFTADGPVEHVKDRPFATVGDAPAVIYDETLERHVAEFTANEERPSTGTGAYVYDIPEAWSAEDPAHVEDVDLLDGGTFECYFRYDGESPVPGGQASQLCAGGPEGYAFYLPATGCCLRFKATATSANKNTASAPIPVKSGEWVHAVATVGNGEVKLYLNGTPAWTLDPEPGTGSGTGRNHAGPYTALKVDSVPKWGIGGSPRTDGIADPAAIAVAASRAWSTVLTDAEVSALWAAEKPASAGGDPGEENPGGEDPADPDPVDPGVDVPSADILDVDFSDIADPFADRSASNRAPKVTGSSSVATDPAFASQPKQAYTADGKKDHAFYPLQDAWADTGMPRTDDMATWADDTWAGPGITLQCDIKVNQALPVTGTPHVCAGKSSGGFGMHLANSSVVAGFHVNGGYKSVSSPTLQPGVWYSVVATFNGTKVDLYLDGKLVGTNTSNTVGAVKAPSGSIVEPYVRYFAFGSDIGARGAIEFPTAVSVGNARIWSNALSAEQADQLDWDSFGDRSVTPQLASSVPAADAAIDAPVEFAITITDETLATGWQYLLDGNPIVPGDTIGAGLEAGAHEIAITATDVFGRPVNWGIPFTSLRIPTGGGTATVQEDGVAVLSATASSVAGNDIATTFSEARMTDAADGVQGTIDRSPTELGLDFDKDASDLTRIDGVLTPGDDEFETTPSSHSSFPFQRFDIDLPNAERGQQLVWSGRVDPARSMKLWAWDVDGSTWSLMSEARGVADGDTHLQSEIHARLIDVSDAAAPVVHVAVTAEDPFADDLAPRDESAGTPELKDRFEDPEDYDFSIAHYTDAQYTTEVATGSNMDWPASLPWRHIEGATNTPEEASVFAYSLRKQNQWIVDNKDERKISFVANTGDVINSNVSLSDLQFDPNAEDPGDGSSVYDYTTADGRVPGAKEQIAKEFAMALSYQEELWKSGLPNQAVAGNHDNYNGTHNGPKSPFSAFFTADGYYDQAADVWPEDASFHTMDEVTDPETGAVTKRGGDSSNSYVLFSAGGLDFVSVGLSYGATQEESDWASSIFERYSDRNGILITHGYVSPSAERDGRGSNLGADGSKLYDEVVRANDNVFLVLGGHFHGIGTNVETIEGNHKVVQMLADYQGYLVPAEKMFSKERCAAAGLDPQTHCVFGTGENEGKIDVNGDGTWDHLTTDKLALGGSFLRMLQFDTKNSTMSVDTYSPFLDEFGTAQYDHGNAPKTQIDPIDRYSGAADNFTVPVNLSTRMTSFSTDGLSVATPSDTVIGTQTAATGTPATVRWSDLKKGETYAWFASSTEASGEIVARAADDAGTLLQFGGMFVAEQAGTAEPGDPGDSDSGGDSDTGGDSDAGGSGPDGDGGSGIDSGDGGANAETDGSLPMTGAEASWVVVAAAVLLLTLGGGLAVFARRRRANGRTDAEGLA
ncbi:LPXTG cell wall anchor domain-containing protein [Microbacterium sp. YMB-B2]|uniref:LPXTG cell wall anchor domain-containing protein n=1 Tax=Microbacterium tenebrionis TaxID=2830665 RepID=A0A9X1RZC5_9MICO|nr:LamG-like jellyroll fold domain-containing protein [Microbacterium tenebrionis]MCC2028080.1 LPXTG cell wall anchor domain-containing protein [Microbacterium tenebrionis]